MFASMITTLAQSVYSICRMEPRLQVPPWSMPLLAGSLAAYGLTEFGFVLLLKHPPTVAAIDGVLAVLLLTGLTAIALTLGGYRIRLPQTLTALAASGAVVGVIHVALRLVLQTTLPDGLPAGMPTFLLFPLFLWNLLIYAYIFRHALAGRSIFAFGLALAYLVSLYAVSQKLFMLMPA